MSNSSKNSFFKKPEIAGALIIFILICGMFLLTAIPFGIRNNKIIPPQIPGNPGDQNIPFKGQVAAEPNLTRTGYPFVLKNYPDLKWRPANESGHGTAQYPTIFSLNKGLIGLNESNIRVAYYDSNYHWQIVPFQIDQVGWPNVWEINDLDYFSGIDGGVGGQLAVGGSFGLGWINGDPSTNNYEDVQDYGDGGNSEAGPWKMAWYPTPVHTYVSTKQLDGSYTSEDVHIDPTLKAHLIWAYENSPQADQDSNLQYAGDYSEDWVNSTTGTSAGLVYMGDTWFQTPWWNPQIDGFIDWDDEIAFYAYNGRQVPNYIWWNYTYFPYRFEIKIVDPVDGGQSWMYIYYNNKSDFNFYLNSSARNLGAPRYTTPIKDYVSWDPSSLTVSSDVYQLSVKESNPSLLDKLKIVKSGSDSQTFIDQFNKMYGFGNFDALGLISGDLSAGREGIWWDYSTPPNPTSKSELIAVLDNPSVWYKQLYSDISDPDRWNDSSPNYYYPSQWMYDTYVEMGHTPSWGSPRLEQWEANFGDKHAIVDGPIRVIQYLLQYLETGIYKPDGGYISGPESWVLVYTSMMDGPLYYYRNMEESPASSVAVPYMGSSITISIYYVYIMCGTFTPNVASDLRIWAGQEWSGGNDGVDQASGSQPVEFHWANQYGWSKIGGIDPKTSRYHTLGLSIPDGGGGAGDGDGDFYYSGGDPLQKANNAQAKPDPNNGGTINLPDWFIIDSETHGGMWVYVPKREVFEIRDNYGSQGLNSPGEDTRLYYRDDGYHEEIGVAAVDGSGPIYGGSSTSPFHQRYVFDVFTGNVTNRADLEYRRYWFSLAGISTFTPQAPPPSFHWEYATPDKTIYRQGETIIINAKGDRDDAYIEADFSGVDLPPGSYIVINHHDTTYTIKYNISNVNHGSNYERIIILNATVPSEPGWDDSIINITINIDDNAPNPGAALDLIPGTTQELAVYLNWTSNPGYDEGSSSVENPSGIDHYRIWRRISTNSPIILFDNIPNTVTQKTDTFLENGNTYIYKIETFDVAGNSINSSEVTTLVDLPYTPAQPSDLPATINPNITSGITIDWSDSPGDFTGVTLQNYYVYRSTSETSGYVDVSGPLSTSTYSWTDHGSFKKAKTYYYKVLSDVAGGGTDLFSAPVYTKIDTVNPNPAIIAEFMPTYYSQSNEIVVSWAIEKLPQYNQGGFPGSDLNGIDHWDLYKKINGGAWTFVDSIPWGSNTEDQRYYDYSVSSGNTYTYGIRTFDAAGNYADSEYSRTTTLQVVGPGRCEVLSVEASPTEVSPGDINVPIKVVIRNPGVGKAVLNSIELFFKEGSIDTTSNYTDIGMYNIGDTFQPFTNKSYWFYVDIKSAALPGLTDIDAKCTYNTTLQDGSAEFPDSWTVLPGSNLLIKTISSPKDVVHPSETGISVSVMINNPGPNTAVIDNVNLKFWRDGNDISNLFLVSSPTPSYPIGPFVGDQLVTFNIDVSSSITSGSVIINATAQGSDTQSQITISDNDGAETTKSWAVQTWPAPVIVSITANASSYWQGDTIELTVTCDSAGYQVSADFSPIDSTGGVETATDNSDGTYTILHTIGSATPGEGNYVIQVTAVNSTTSTQDQDNITLKKGNPPQFSNWVQSPTDGNVNENVPVQVNITITDDGGNDNVNAHLEYKIDLGSWIYLDMTYLGSGDWTVTIPGQNGGVKVYYKIIATDLNDNSAVFNAEYNVTSPIVYPTIVDSYPHQEGNPGNQYSTSNHAPLDTNISHYAELGSDGIIIPTTYVVVVSAFDSARHCFLEANTSVIVQEPNPTNVELNLIIPSSVVSSGSYIYGHIYLLTDWPKNGGKIVASSFFDYNVS